VSILLLVYSNAPSFLAFHFLTYYRGTPDEQETKRASPGEQHAWQDSIQMIDKLPPLEPLIRLSRGDDERQARSRSPLSVSSPRASNSNMPLITSRTRPSTDSQTYAAFAPIAANGVLEQRRLRSQFIIGEQGRLLPVLSSTSTGNSYVFLGCISQSCQPATNVMLAAPIEGSKWTSWHPHSTERVIIKVSPVLVA
jgi:hypothetical protein